MKKVQEVLRTLDETGIRRNIRILDETYGMRELSCRTSGHGTVVIQMMITKWKQTDRWKTPSDKGQK